jgi:hypothetical protein
MQFYPGDWRRNPKVQSLTYEERGLWFEMLCLMHFAEPRGKLPLEDLPMLLGIDQAKAKQTVAKLLAKEVANTEQNYIICRRMIKESKISELRAKAGFQGGSKAQAKAQAKRKQNNVAPSPSPTNTTTTTKIKKEPPTPLNPKKEIPKDLELLGVKVYFAEINCPPEEAEKFFDHFESNGWKVGGKAPMRDWQAAARNWKRGWLEKNPNLRPKPKPLPKPPPPQDNTPLTPEEQKAFEEAKRNLPGILGRIGKKIPDGKPQQCTEVLRALEEERGKR